MTKSKNFWAALAVVALIAAGFSGYSLYNRLTVHFASDTMEIKPKPVPVPADAEKPEEEPPAETADENAVPEAEKDEQAKPQAAKETRIKPQAVKEEKARPQAAKEEPQKIKAVKIHFEYKNSSAKTVSLTGSFTRWKEIKMTKQNGVWRSEVYILPGRYLYHFVVSGKKTLDPARPKGPIGESIIIVEEGRPATGKK